MEFQGVGDQSRVYSLLSANIFDSRQQLREFTQNGIEAGASMVIWDIDWSHHKKHGTWKLTAIDNGVGIPHAELSSMLKICSGSKAFALDKNFGIGAKVASLRFNRAGVLYESWNNGIGGRMIIQEGGDPPNILHSAMDLISQPRIDYGTSKWSACALGPQQSGTAVTLLGDKKSGNVSKTVGRWVAKYLNTRYFRFPDDVAVYVRDGWSDKVPRREMGNKETSNWLRHILGLRHFLEKSENKQSSGMVPLKVKVGRYRLDVNTHWWLLKEDHKMHHNYAEDRGFVASIYKNEIHDLARERRLHGTFGIFKGGSQVFILVEPKGEYILPSKSRTELHWRGTVLPWDAIGEAFRQSMPTEIEEYLNSNVEFDSSASMKKRISKYRHLLSVDLYRQANQGQPIHIDNILSQHSTTKTKQGTTRHSGDGNDSNGGNSGNSGNGQKNGTPQYRFDPLGSDKGTKTDVSEECPDVMWVFERDMDTSNVAAEYNSAQRHIKCNKEFMDWVVLLKHCCAGRPTNVIGWVEIKARLIYTLDLCDSIMRAEGLLRVGIIDQNDFDRRTSPEALTAVCCAWYNKVRTFNLEIGGFLKLKAKAAAKDAAKEEAEEAKALTEVTLKF